ncbi:GDP-L-fucose synthase [Pelosinus fermentans]|uniref:GDP-L-fucose synthase n=1 Tax=Pelosinus fermentans JBW45 TaxID=1192197 RepID=I9NMX8_9FIRM|nr:GDP-L-fucose synthase [Pelosinus fermentans]AJQ27102.1 GDP-L-fucose synthase [Pelosinus fermentans JBW45]
MDKHAKIYIAGHGGLVGSAILGKLKKHFYKNIIFRTSKELDLRNQEAVATFFAIEQPEYVFMAAAKVGGILANDTYPATFIYDNVMMQANIINAAYQNKVKKLLFLGSSCIYPKLAPQPIKEEYLLTGELEATNAPYAIAKIAGITMCQAYNEQYGTTFISVMPTNLYGPNDNFDLTSSHVLPALIRKFHEAKMNHLSNVEIWGTGKPRREFLHVDDLADACLFLMNQYQDNQPLNIGVGKDISIAELATLIAAVVGYSGNIMYNTAMPDGTPRKLLDVSKLADLGWRPSIELEDGIRRTYQWYLKNLVI